MSHRQDSSLAVADDEADGVGVGLVIGIPIVVAGGGVAGIGAGGLGGLAAAGLVARVLTLVLQDRRVRSSSRSGGVEWPRFCRDGTLRRLLRACISVERLVDYLLDRALDTLPVAARARFAEEWGDHRRHYAGWRLVWWALCVRATAPRTNTALGPARFPREE
jgi:hypothetical protein